MLRAALIVLTLLTVHVAAAQEMKSPRIARTTADWEAAAAGLAERPPGTPAQAFASLNALSQARFPDIGKSPVPVLLPLDVASLRKAQADKPDAPVDKFMRGGFHATAFFQAGPAGFDAGFSLRTAEIKELSDIRYSEPVYVLFSGLAMLYELDGPPLPQGEPVKSLDDVFPGIRRILHESYVRYSFERYGVTYVAAIYCRDVRPRPRLLSCKQADRIAERFLRGLQLAGGTPGRASVEPVALDRPSTPSKDFTYFSPGYLIPGTGRKKDLGGVADYTVYAHLRFPMKEAPDFANSQSFNNWGDCDFTGRSRRYLRGKGTPYFCKVNGRPLVFDESTNYTYPWRDNFCEHRRYFVGQCPGGEGHQGQDIRPSSCTMFNEGADRCKPYRHDLVAVHDGVILRDRKQEAVFLFINTASAHMRVRYMHMNPRQLDGDGILTGKQVAAGETIGKVGNYNKKERGTTYHLHFDMQVPTRVGYVFVNPYMTLVAAYERLLGERGREIKPGEPAPPAMVMTPVLERPDLHPDAGAAQAKETVVVKDKAEPRPPRRHRHAHKRHRHTARR